MIFYGNRDEEFNPKLYIRSKWEPDLAPTAVEKAINEFETNTNTLFNASRIAAPMYNIQSQQIKLLRLIKKERKLIITETDKGLGPAIMEIDKYIKLFQANHLNDRTNYCEIDQQKADIIDYTNYRWICERFIDFREPGTVTNMEQRFFSWITLWST